MFSCKECKDKNCENGYCFGDLCVCDDGYFGDNCEFEKHISTITTSAVLYTKCGSGVGSVSVNGGSFKNFNYCAIATPSNCDDNDDLNNAAILFNLDAGSHTYITDIGSTGSFIVNEGVCRLVQVN